ncbi:uncharacterized protein LOC124534158 [Vanessa cardui]|uniref:uncharacterized protein LOC124534158 n=1 Tax=Vanessa cardui TaxID=171605 RepID=UPI001F14858D|nr:uncharacterized protein LOC124534158 [Vanessa cardui]
MCTYGLRDPTTSMIEIVFQNLKYNGWNNILIMGHLPNTLFHRLSVLPFTFAVTNIANDDDQIEDVIPYQSNIIIMSCADLDEFEKAMKKIVTLPYWHPLAKIILYYHSKYHKETIAKMFFIYWFYRAINVIIVQYDETEKEMLISYYSPYMTEIHLGTCLGFETEKIQLTNLNRIQKLNLFEDKGKNLHGFTLYAYTVEVLPFLKLEEHEDGTYTYHRRDGMIWNTMAELFNFKIDITPAKKAIKEKFDYEINVLQVFSFAQRKADLILFP